MRVNLTGRQKEYGFLAVLVLGFGILYLSLCFNNNVWTDEAFTVELLQEYHSFGEIAAYTARDVHPPLYYWILHLFTEVFGVKLLLLKILSILPMLLTMLLGITFVAPRFGTRSGILYLLMVGVIPCSMEYAVQARMYSWALFFVTACGVSALRALEEDKLKNWIMLVLSGAAAAYTHYFALAAVLWIYGFLFLALCFRQRKKLLWWLGSVVVSCLVYLPWTFSLARQLGNVSESYWIPEITGEVILSYFDFIFEADLPLAVLMMEIIFGIALVRSLLALVSGGRRPGPAETAGLSGTQGLETRRGDALIGLLALLVPVCTAITGVAASNLIRPIFIARYLIPCIGMAALFFAVAMRELDKKAYAALVVFLLFLGLLDYKKTFHQEYRATFTAQTEAFFEENLGPDDIIAFNFKAYDFIYAYYWDKDRLQYVEDVDLGADYDTIWFLDTHFNPEFNRDALAENGWTMTYIGNYGIEHDEFKIYKLTRNE